MNSILETSAPRILIIDDEESICTMIQSTLAPAGYSIQTTTSAETGIEWAKQEPVDLIIFDLRMPDVDGLEMFKTVKEYCVDTAGIVMTGTPDVVSTVAAMRLGVFDYLVKPFDIDELIQAVNKALEHQHATRQLSSAQAMNALQSELLLHMSHEFKLSLENIGQQSQKLLQLVNHILELPRHPSGRLPSSPLEWHSVLQRISKIETGKSKANVLVVDDDVAVVELLQYLLTKEGYDVDSAENGQTALEKMKARRPDFLILDLVMPELNGFDFLEAIHQTPSLKDLPVMIFTARYLTDTEKTDLMKRTQAVFQKGQSNAQEIVALLNEYSLAFRSLITAK